MSASWLVLAHQATNSGAPRLLLEVMRGVRAADADWRCEILLDHDGPLAGEFATLGPVHQLTPPWAEGPGLAAKVMRGLVDRPWLKPRRLQAKARDWQARGGGIIFSNTGTNGRLLAALPPSAGPVVSYVHELGYGLRRFNRPADLAATLARTDLFLAVSSAVLADLAELGVPTEKMRLLPNFLPELPPAADRVAARAQVNRLPGLTSGTRLVVGCGHLDPVKGTDLFVELAAQVAAAGGAPVSFVWVGGVIDREFAARVRAAAGPAVHFAGEVADVAPYFAAADVVTVTSRAESFSRVALEAAALGRPVVAFAGARGPADLLGPEDLVPGHSVEAMAGAVVARLAEPARAEQDGMRLRETVANRFLARHWIGPLLTAIREVGDA